MYGVNGVLCFAIYFLDHRSDLWDHQIFVVSLCSYFSTLQYSYQIVL